MNATKNPWTSWGVSLAAKRHFGGGVCCRLFLVLLLGPVAWVAGDDGAFPPLGPAFDALGSGADRSDPFGSGSGASRDMRPDTSEGEDGWRRIPLMRPMEPDRATDPDGDSPRATPRTRPVPEPSLSERLTYRYRDPAVARFLRDLGGERGVQLFMEVSHLLDTRHLRPVSYQKRVERGVAQLAEALSNPAFLRAANLSASSARASGFRQKLTSLSAGWRVASRDDAVRVLRGTMDLAYRELGLHPSAVALEWVYASTECHDRYSLFRPSRRAGAPAAGFGDPVVGVGVEIKTHERGALIVRTIEGGPAAAAGLQAGDLVLAVDGRSLLGLSLEEVVDLVTGSVGARVQLRLDRSGRIRDVSLTRRQLVIPSVRDVRLLADETGVGYLRLDQFTNDSAAEIDRALWSLHRQGMRALVIDLRGNPGGLLSSAIAISNKFLPCGTIVSTRGRLAEDNMLERARFAQTWKIPLVVLVDSGSASASEIFAAAIQENQRGVVVGQPSYGKGTVQTEFPLRSVSASLRITTAKFYSPDGRPMAGAGVTPDIVVPVTEAGHGSESELRAAARAAVGQAVRNLAQHGRECPNVHQLVGQR